MTFNFAIALGLFVQRAARWSRPRVKPYRPERHYMRGPGPQWRAKHDMLTAESESVSARSTSS